MRMGYDLTLEQQQKLIMTPELKLALKILQLPAVELDELIGQEVETNPVLDFEEETREIRNEKEQKKEKEEQKIDKEEKENDIDWKEYLQYQGKNYYLENSQNDDSNDNAFDNLTTYSYTLKDHLLLQLHISILKPEYNEIAEYIIESLDENGYLTVLVEELSTTFNLDINEIEKILSIVQTFDPIGVAARNVKECLLLQLKIKNELTDRLKIVIEEHLDDIANNRLNNIAKRFSISLDEVQKLSDKIKSLEPKPGRSFEGSISTKYLVPDAYVEKVEDDYVVTINDRYASKLMINQYYKNILNCEDKSSEACQYINDKLSSAIWLIKSLEHRKNTLYNVIKAIIEYQKDFFDKGVMYLKGMTLKTIADKVNVHESTVSRAISNKCMQTPKGTFDIKYFFSNGINSGMGSSVSSVTIKRMIKDLIDNENTSKPISDQEISDKLIQEGVSISRRTIAKYRDEMNVPSSSKRRRYKA